MSTFFKQLDEQYIVNNFDSILVLGDIHGTLSPFERAVAHADQNNLFILSLGDLVDYNTQSKEVVYLMKSVIDANKGCAILGNHEKKAHRYFTQKKEGNIRVKVKPSLQATIDSFDSEDAINAFFAIHDTMAHVMRFKNVFFAHGAVHPSLLDKQEYSPLGYQFSLFGEVDNKLPPREDGFPNRVFNWVKDIRDPYTAWVGHDVRSKEAPVVEGRVTFLDTGCAKHGVLHGAVLNHNGENQGFINFGG